VKEDEVDGAEHIGEMRSTHRILIGKRKGKRPLGRPRHTDTDWWQGVANMGMNLWVP
jgi:hypothetical protein